MADDLDTLLDGGSEPQKAVEPTVAPQIEAEAPPQQPQEATQTTAEAPSGPAPLIEDGERSALVAQAKDERRKRQELERQIAELTKRASAPQPQQTQQQEPQQRAMPQRPDPWVDPEGAAEYDRAMHRVELFETRVLLSKEFMRSSKPDFDDVEKVFIEAARSDPYLEQQLVSHPMPAKFAYEHGRRIMALREIGDDPAAYKDRIRQELLAELGQQAPSATTQRQTGAAPKSLASTASTQPRRQDGRFAPSDGPASLDDILGG